MKLAEKIKEMVTNFQPFDTRGNINNTEVEYSESLRLKEDLGFDSLDSVEFIMDIEKQFEVGIPDDEAEKIKTIGDIIKIIESKSSKKEKRERKSKRRRGVKKDPVIIIKLSLPDDVKRLESGPIQFGDDWPGIFLRGDDTIALSLYLSQAVSALEDAGNGITAEALKSWEKLLKSCHV